MVDKANGTFERNFIKVGCSWGEVTVNSNSISDLICPFASSPSEAEPVKVSESVVVALSKDSDLQLFWLKVK